jgi:RNAse (barnase) inhibitor barstar
MPEPGEVGKATPIRTLFISGAAIHDIPSFYDEINRVFMAGEDWTLGHSLDALDDLLYGGYGAIAGRQAVTLVWQDIAASRAALGVEATRALLRGKLDRPDIYNVAAIGRQLADLDAGTGKTFFDIVLDIVADHPNIALVAA